MLWNLASLLTRWIVDMGLLSRVSKWKLTLRHPLVNPWKQRKRSGCGLRRSHLQQGKAKCFPFNQPGFRHPASQIADPTDRCRSLRHRNHPTCLQKIEGVTALKNKIESRRRKLLINQIPSFRLVNRKQLLQSLWIRSFKVVRALTLFKRKPEVSITP